MFLGQSGIKNFKSVQYILFVKGLSVSSMLSSLRLASSIGSLLALSLSTPKPTGRSHIEI